MTLRSSIACALTMLAALPACTRGAPAGAPTGTPPPEARTAPPPAEPPNNALRLSGVGTPEGPAPTDDGSGDLDACRALRDFADLEIGTQEEDDRAQAALNRCLGSGVLPGLSRAEVEAVLGPGEPCGGYFETFGFEADDVYYPIGRLPEGWVGGVPNLVLGFAGDGRCERAMAVHTQ